MHIQIIKSRHKKYQEGGRTGGTLYIPVVFHDVFNDNSAMPLNKYISGIVLSDNKL